MSPSLTLENKNFLFFFWQRMQAHTAKVKKTGIQQKQQAICRRTKWVNEQVNSDGALNGCDREKAATGSSTEGTSDPETASKVRLAPASLEKEEKNVCRSIEVSLLKHTFCPVPSVFLQ